MVGLAFLMAGLAAIAASSGCGSRASCAGDSGLRSPQALQALLLLQPRSHEGTGSEAHARPTQKPSTPPEVNLAKVLEGLKDNEHFNKDSEEQAWEADKLAKRQARTPEVAVQSALSALQNREAAMAKSQDKIAELEAAAKKAAEAVEEAKQKAEKLQGEIDKLQKEYDEELARPLKPSDPVTHLQSNVRAAFQALSGNPEAQPLIAQLETAFTGLSSLVAAATPTPMATEVRGDEELLLLDKEKDISHEALAFARTFERSLLGLPEEEREAKKAKMVEYVEQARQV